MYCSSCGVALTPGLSYCNYCGAKQNRSDDGSRSRELPPSFLVAAMVGMFIFGLVAITMLLGVLKNAMGVPVDQALVIAALPFLLMLVLEGVFLRLLFRQLSSKNEPTAATQLKGHATRELDTAEPLPLPSARASVTEHTTRAFHPVPTDRKRPKKPRYP